jgi:hypothetical protein
MRFRDFFEDLRLVSVVLGNDRRKEFPLAWFEVVDAAVQPNLD